MQAVPPASLSWRHHCIYLLRFLLHVPLMPRRQFAQQLKSGVSPSALLALHRGCFLQTHSLTYDSWQGNSWQLVSWVWGINSRQNPRWVMMGRLDGCWHGAALIGPAAAWRHEAGNKAGLELLEGRQCTGDPTHPSIHTVLETEGIPAYTPTTTGVASASQHSPPPQPEHPGSSDRARGEQHSFLSFGCVVLFLSGFWRVDTLPC